MEIKPRIDLKNRTKLETVIPLSVPFIIYVDPSDVCNFRCKFCPTGDMALMKKVGRGLKVMDFDLYKKIVDDICKFERPIKVLRLYKDGEPLLNPRFAKMVRYAKSKKCAERIDTTTNASLLNPKINREIIDAGLDRINISIEGVNAKQYVDFSNYKIDFNKLVANIEDLYRNRKNCEIIIKINGDLISKKDEEKFCDIFGKIADGISIEHIASCWPEFNLPQGFTANKSKGIYGQSIKEVLVCPYVFYSFAINSDGIASACFLDWQRKLVVGDVNKQSLTQIWHGSELQELRLEMLRGNRKSHPICNNCDQLRRGQPDNIDDYREVLLKKIKNQK